MTIAIPTNNITKTIAITAPFLKPFLPLLFSSLLLFMLDASAKKIEANKILKQRF